MTTESSFLDRLKSGSPVLSAWCGIPEPAISAILAREAFDAVTFDLQHGAVDFANAVRAIPLVAAAGKPAVVRIPVGDFATASRFLDAGAAGVIAPMINSLEDAQRFAGFMKYPPVGERSWGPHGAITLTGLSPDTYFQKGNGLSAAFAMIETKQALNIIDDILAVPGIDGIFIGPSDLSIGLSQGRDTNPTSTQVEQAIDHALARAKAANKLAAIYAASGARAGELARKGFHMVSIASDIALLKAGAQAALAAARP